MYSKFNGHLEQRKVNCQFILKNFVSKNQLLGIYLNVGSFQTFENQLLSTSSIKHFNKFDIFLAKAFQVDFTI